MTTEKEWLYELLRTLEEARKDPELPTTPVSTVVVSTPPDEKEESNSTAAHAKE
jgi:hypothetical protein